MKINILDKNGNKTEEITLSKGVFGNEVNKDLILQYLHVYLTNQRQGTSSTKTRGDVSGGGKKPWAQKGTGRARHGSRRSPLWVHGGIAHGPKPKEWSLSLPKKMKRKAMLSALSLIASDSKIMVIDDIKLKKPSTKEVENILKNLKLDNKTLIILNSNDRVLRKSFENIKTVNTSLVNTLNIYELLNANKVLFLKDALEKIEEKYK